MTGETRFFISLTVFAMVVGAISTPAAVVLPSVVLGMWLGRGITEMQTG